MGRGGSSGGGGGGGGGGRSSRSRSSGGRSSYSRGGSSYSRGGSSSYSSIGSTHYHHHSHYGSSPYIGGSGGGGLAVAVIILLVLFILFSLPGSSGGITASTWQREPLAKGSYTETEYVYDYAKWINSKSSLTKDLKYFADKTGVQPVLVIIDDAIENLNIDSEDFYEEYINDEAHLVFIFDEDKNDNWNMYYTTGALAKTVLDDEAMDILMDYIENYYYTNKTEDDMFGDAFVNAADRIMSKTTPWYVYVGGGLVLVGLAGGLYVVLSNLRKKKEEENRHLEEMLKTDVY